MLLCYKKILIRYTLNHNTINLSKKCNIFLLRLVKFVIYVNKYFLNNEFIYNHVL